MTDDQWRHAKPVLTQALGLDPGERDRLLCSAFADEPALRADLLQVLREMDAASARVSLVPAGEASGSFPGDDIEPAFLEPGEICGRYRVVRFLGAGGMGRVYLAEDIDLGSPAALKLVSSRLLDSSGARAHLRREAARASQLRYHPHIATVLQFFDVELKGRSVAVLAMEFVPGRAASALLAEGPVGVDRALRWTIQAAQAIEFAHEKGVLHCDLKPANLQIEQAPAGDRVKVVDFGIARALFGGPSGAAAGTPAYMAPEQVTGGKYGPPVDIYALGVTLFELVTGRRPFGGVDRTDLLMQVLGAPLPRASTLNAALPAALDRVLERAMAKAPEARYPSMAAFRRDLEALLPTPAGRSLRTVTAAVVAGAAFVTAAGFVASQALDQGLGRVVEFRITSLATWFYWGIRSLVAPAVFALALLVGFLVVTSVVRLFWTISFVRSSLDPLVAPVRTAVGRLTSLPGTAIAQLVLLAHVAVLAALWVYFQPLLASIMFFMMALPEPIDALSPANSEMHESFGYVVTAALLVFSLAWYRVVRLHAHRDRDGLAFVIAGVAALVFSGLLFTARFRILAHNESERVSYRSETCYLVEDREATALLFCPMAYPRNVIAPAADVVRTGNIENVFQRLNPQ